MTVVEDVDTPHGELVAGAGQMSWRPATSTAPSASEFVIIQLSHPQD